MGSVVQMSTYIEEIEKLIKENEDLYLWYRKQNNSRADSLGLVRDYSKLQQHYLDTACKYSIQISFRVDELKDKFNWHCLKDREKDRLLWNLGMDTYNCQWDTHLRRVWDIRGNEKLPKKAQLLIKEVVYGNERLDDEWLNLRKEDYSFYASYEARNYKLRYFKT